MTNEVDAAHLSAWTSFLQAHAAVVGAVEADLQRERSLPLSWYEVLARLSRQRDQSMRMQELAQGALLSKSGLTRLVDRMQAAGLVERRPCSEDRRATYASMTSAGREALVEAGPVFRRSLERHFAEHIDCQEVGSFLAALRQLIEGNGQRPLAECHSVPSVSPEPAPA